MDDFYAVMHACKRAAEALENADDAEMNTGLYKGSPRFSEIAEQLSIVAVRVANAVSCTGNVTLRVSSILGHPFFEKLEG